MYPSSPSAQEEGGACEGGEEEGGEEETEGSSQAGSCSTGAWYLNSGSGHRDLQGHTSGHVSMPCTQLHALLKHWDQCGAQHWVHTYTPCHVPTCGALHVPGTGHCTRVATALSCTHPERGTMCGPQTGTYTLHTLPHTSPPHWHTCPAHTGMQTMQTLALVVHTGTCALHTLAHMHTPGSAVHVHGPRSDMGQGLPDTIQGRHTSCSTAWHGTWHLPGIASVLFSRAQGGL